MPERPDQLCAGSEHGRRKRRMCPNRECEKFGEPTGLMGGCDCGTQLVAFRTRDQQVSDALWDIASPTMKRLVGYSMFAEIDRRRREQES